ncbi:MAG: dihydroorotate dehydrogenase-like protein [Mariniphaga sp.]|nr:dihydroorotate dehydrogenase-like protein [Mariniphaga sp.]
MADLRTTYMGVELKNPIILGASSLVEDAAAIEKIERAGVSAIVFRSLFEEQIHLEQIQMEDQLVEYDNRNAEMIRLFPEIRHGGAKEHLFKLEKLISKVNIPVFASLNAMYEESWEEYALALEETGIAGLELNFYDVPVNGILTGSEIEAKQVRILTKLKKAIKIPVSVKLSPFYANPLNMIELLDKAGVNSVVLFNRFFQPEINIETEEFFYPFDLTHQKDYQLSLRFAGLLYGNIAADICTSRGISDGNDVIKMLLAGADSVQVVSAIYKNKASHITSMLEMLEEWMDARGYKTIDAFKGKLSMKNIKDPYAYKRAQYVDILMKSNEILKKYPMV